MTKEKIRICIIENFKLIRTAFIRALSEYTDLEIVENYEQADVFIISAEEIQSIKDVKKKYPNVGIIVLYSGDVDETIITLGVNAVTFKDIEIHDLYKVIILINKGGYLYDSKIGERAIKLFRVKKRNKNIEKLTARERQILKLVAKGLSNTEIAKLLFISAHTAKVHVSNILNKLEVSDRVQASIKACENDLLDDS